MNKKISLGTVIGLIAIAVAITSAITINAVKLSYNSILKNLPERSQRYALLEELQDIIDENYYGKRSREELLSSLGRGVGVLGNMLFALLSFKLDYHSSCNVIVLGGCSGEIQEFTSVHYGRTG